MQKNNRTPEQAFGGSSSSMYEEASKAYMLSPEDAEKKYASDSVRGLSDEEAKSRLAKYGANAFEKQKKKSLLSLPSRSSKTFLR